MSTHVASLLPEYALGLLSAAEHAVVTKHLTECVPCAREARAYSETTAAVASSVPAKEPPSFLRARLLASAAASGRLARFSEALASFFEISTDRARALLDMLDEPASWERDAAGIDLIHLAAGPRYAAMGADAGLVRFPAGMQWPLHRHVGEEHHLLLDGGIRIDGTGQELHPGDTLVSPPGSEHSFLVLPDRDCIAAVILTKGIEMPPGTPFSFS